MNILGTTFINQNFQFKIQLCIIDFPDPDFVNLHGEITFACNLYFVITIISRFFVQKRKNFIKFQQIRLQTLTCIMLIFDKSNYSTYTNPTYNQRKLIGNRIKKTNFGDNFVSLLRQTYLNWNLDGAKKKIR